MSFVFSEHLRLERPEPRALLPGVWWQPRLLTRVGEKRLAIPAPLCGDLRQQQTTVPSLFDHQPMPAHHDLFDVGHRFEW